MFHGNVFVLGLIERVIFEHVDEIVSGWDIHVTRSIGIRPCSYFIQLFLGVSLGQDFAELLGVVGLLPCHPSTQLRLRKVHETRANTVIKETPGMMGEVDLIEAARKRLALEDEHLYTKRDGFQEAGSECECICF